MVFDFGLSHFYVFFCVWTNGRMDGRMDGFMFSLRLSRDSLRQLLLSHTSLWQTCSMNGKLGGGEKERNYEFITTLASIPIPISISISISYSPLAVLGFCSLSLSLRLVSLLPVSGCSSPASVPSVPFVTNPFVPIVFFHSVTVRPGPFHHEKEV